MKLFTMLLKSTGNLVRSDRVQVLFGIKNEVRVLDIDVNERTGFQAYFCYGDILK